MKNLKIKPIQLLAIIVGIGLLVIITVQIIKNSNPSDPEVSSECSTISKLTYIDNNTPTFSTSEDSSSPCTEETSELIPEESSAVTSEVSKMENPPFIEFTDEEKYILACLVYLEARGETLECQKAVASVVINRMLIESKSLEQIIYAPNQFTPAKHIKDTTPNADNIEAVEYVVQYGPTLPYYVTFFRAYHYHNFSDKVVPYAKIDNTYFSYFVDYKD